MYSTTNIRVIVTDGKRKDGVGKCHKAKLQLSDYELESSFYTVPIGRSRCHFGNTTATNIGNILRKSAKEIY